MALTLLLVAPFSVRVNPCIFGCLRHCKSLGADPWLGNLCRYPDKTKVPISEQLSLYSKAQCKFPCGFACWFSLLVLCGLRCAEPGRPHCQLAFIWSGLSCCFRVWFTGRFVYHEKATGDAQSKNEKYCV